MQVARRQNLNGQKGRFFISFALQYTEIFMSMVAVVVQTMMEADVSIKVLW